MRFRLALCVLLASLTDYVFLGARPEGPEDSPLAAVECAVASSKILETISAAVAALHKIGCQAYEGMSNTPHNMHDARPSCNITADIYFQFLKSLESYSRQQAHLRSINCKIDTGAVPLARRRLLRAWKTYYLQLHGETSSTSESATRFDRLQKLAETGNTSNARAMAQVLLDEFDFTPSAMPNFRPTNLLAFQRGLEPANFDVNEELLEHISQCMADEESCIVLRSSLQAHTTFPIASSSFLQGNARFGRLRTSKQLFLFWLIGTVIWFPISTSLLLLCDLPLLLVSFGMFTCTQWSSDAKK